ncbi:hypothetical protein DQG23_05710 [Paenibacillus contaminans]|uniref:Uncharacterized protein n=1 Tax=Paenibacillus contaminans TaxID=450362 RepID=A0A329MRL5_9BACL|nr:hypothetical protein DQG23_05710 [Paenibacillus contaminans]
MKAKFTPSQNSRNIAHLALSYMVPPFSQRNSACYAIRFNDSDYILLYEDAQRRIWRKTADFLEN